MTELEVQHVTYQLRASVGVGFLPEPNPVLRDLGVAVAQVVGIAVGVGTGLGIMWLLGRLP